MNAIDTLALRGGIALLAAAASACAFADGVVRVRPDPPGVQSVDAPDVPATATIPETWITTDRGVVRVRAGAPDAAGQARSGAPVTMVVSGPHGQAIRYVPGVQPDPTTATASSALPAGAFVVEVGRAKMLRIPGVADGRQGSAAAAQLAPGMRIVDLPPGAVAPIGMPEPMTLYRGTSGPVSPTPLPVAPK